MEKFGKTKEEAEEAQKNFRLEADIMKQLHSDYVVKIVDTYEEKKNGGLIIVMEYCRFGDLSNQI